MLNDFQQCIKARKPMVACFIIAQKSQKWPEDPFKMSTRNSPIELFYSAYQIMYHGACLCVCINLQSTKTINIWRHWSVTGCMLIEQSESWARQRLYAIPFWLTCSRYFLTSSIFWKLRIGLLKVSKMATATHSRILWDPPITLSQIL